MCPGYYSKAQIKLILRTAADCVCMRVSRTSKKTQPYSCFCVSRQGLDFHPGSNLRLNKLVCRLIFNSTDFLCECDWQLHPISNANTGQHVVKVGLSLRRVQSLAKNNGSVTFACAQKRNAAACAKWVFARARAIKFRKARSDAAAEKAHREYSRRGRAQHRNQPASHPVARAGSAQAESIKFFK